MKDLPPILPVVKGSSSVGLRYKDSELTLNVSYGMNRFDPIEAFALLYKALAVFKTAPTSKTPRPNRWSGTR
jgi:hypothetical protein